MIFRTRKLRYVVIQEQIDHSNWWWTLVSVDQLRQLYISSEVVA